MWEFLLKVKLALCVLLEDIFNGDLWIYDGHEELSKERIGRLTGRKMVRDGIWDDWKYPLPALDSVWVYVEDGRMYKVINYDYRNESFIFNDGLKIVCADIKNIEASTSDCLCIPAPEWGKVMRQASE